MIACASANADATNRHKAINCLASQTRQMASLVLDVLGAPAFVSFSELTGKAADCLAGHTRVEDQYDSFRGSGSYSSDKILVLYDKARYEVPDGERLYAGVHNKCAGMLLQQRAGGERVFVAGLHLQRQRNVRKQTLINLLTYAQEQYEQRGADALLLKGDFNMKADEIQKILDEFGVADMGLKLAFGSEDPPTAKSGVIDNVIYGGTFEDLVSKRVVESYEFLSHKPIQAGLGAADVDAHGDVEPKEPKATGKSKDASDAAVSKR